MFQNIQVLLTKACDSFADMTTPLLNNIRNIANASHPDIKKLSAAITTLEDTIKNADFDLDNLFFINLSNLSQAITTIVVIQQTLELIIPPEIEFIQTEVLRVMRAECARIEKLASTTAKSKDSAKASFIRIIAQDTIRATEYIANLVATDIEVLHKYRKCMTEKERKKREKDKAFMIVFLNIKRFIRILLVVHCRLVVARIVALHPTAEILIPTLKDKIQILEGRDFNTF
jgi:hypothetical protein